MRPSKNCEDLIQGFEKLILHAYKDPGSKDGLPITIGWGNTMYTDGSKIKITDIITKERADELFGWELNNKAVVIDGHKLNLNQNQFDAICSFVYNVGLSAFLKSHLYKMIKMNPNDLAISEEFKKWKFNDGKIMKGLIRRRDMESTLYSKPI